jgi:alpha-mannosidase
MAKRVDLSRVEEGAVFLLNPLPWRRKALVEYYTGSNPSGQARITHLASKDGVKVPVQWRPSASMTPTWFPRIHAWVELPPCGYRVFELAHGDAPTAEPFNAFATVSESGFGISSLKAGDGTELLAAPIGLVAISDTSDTWAHGISQFRHEIGRPTLVSSAVVEDGPVTRITRHRARWQSSEIVVDIAQFAGMDFVELRFVIDWHEREQMLKLEIPTALAGPRILAKVPGEVLERHPNGEEEPYQDWIAVEGKHNDADYTVSLVNNSTYSYDCLDGLLRTVLIRSAPFARHNPNQVPYNDNNAWQDQGRQERRFWLMCRRGRHEDLALDRRAEELQTPAEFVMDSAHGGTEPWEHSFFEVTPDNVWILALKRAEGAREEQAHRASAGTILRIQERSGTATKARIKSSALGLDQTVDLNPWELKTLLIQPSSSGPADLREVSLLET